MNKEFVLYDESLKLKELGFDEDCFGYYENQSKILVIYYNNLPLTDEQEKRKGLYTLSNRNSLIPQWATSAPTHQQVFKWFRDKYNLYLPITEKNNYFISKGRKKYFFDGIKCETDSFEEAEYTSIKKLIEIAKMIKDVETCKKNKLKKLTEHQFHTVWTTAAYMKGYDKRFFQNLFQQLFDKKLIEND